MTTNLSTTPAIGYGTCDRCLTTCTEVAYDNRALRMNPDERYLCTARCYRPVVPALFDLNEINWVTATVTTESGSQHVVIARPWGVSVTCTRGSHAGQTVTGTHLHIVGGSLWVRDNDNDRTIMRTTALVTVDVHEN